MESSVYRPDMDAAEREMRVYGRLSPHKLLHPVLNSFARLVDAIAFRRRLIQNGHYVSEDVGVFAQDVHTGGAKRWLVDTFVGFARSVAPRDMPHNALRVSSERRHMYEVILENSPCWLHFDLEFSREANPNIDACAAMAAFRLALRMFTVENFAVQPEFTSALELESTSSQKFSRHVIVKGWRPVSNMEGKRGGPPRWIAFPNNSQAGAFVARFMQYLGTMRQQETAPIASRLYMKHQRSADEVSMIDTSIYTRNRCFRVLFSSKFGKQEAFLPGSGFVADQSPALQLLTSLVSWVPAAVEMFPHHLSDPTAPRTSLRASAALFDCSIRLPLDGPDGQSMKATGVRELFVHLASAWNQVRAEHECCTASEACAISKAVQIEARYLAATLRGNRFCLCKKASHRSNCVYLVVDCIGATFRQKCHDYADCGGFRSQDFKVPGGMLDGLRGDDRASRYLPFPKRIRLAECASR